MKQIDNHWTRGIYSDGSSDYLSNCHPKSGETLTIYLRVPTKSPIQSVHLWGSQKGSPFLRTGYRQEEDQRYRKWRMKVLLEGRVLRYNFVLVSNGKAWIYNQLGTFEGIPASEHDFKIISDFECPRWVYGRTFYQIFPDRFHNGDETTTPIDGSKSSYGAQIRRMDWNAKPLEYDEGRCLDFFGGDLPGIGEKLDYLESLEINALYLNPIFQAPSHHKYDCQDYLKVDPAFGGNQGLENLIKDCKRRDMRLILDISVNHVGSTHHWFNREGVYGPDTGVFQNRNDPAGAYFVGSGSEFHRWDGVDELLTLNYDSPELRKIIYKDPRSVLKFWLQEPYGTDGWRFDVGHSMAREGHPHLYREIWQEIREELKALDPEKYLMAELWEDPEEYLQGDQWDACMNYQGFLRPVRSFLGEKDWFLRGVLGKKRGEPGDANSLKNALLHIRAKLPFQIQNLQFNLLNSHDIYRFYHLKPFDFQRHRLCAILLMTYPGVPSIYYGDEQEIGGHTHSNEGCRYPMVWKDSPESSPSFLLYSSLGRLRKRSKALRYGGFLTLFSDGGIFAYARFLEGECILCVLSNEAVSREISIPLELINPIAATPLKELFSRYGDLDSSRDTVSVQVPPNDGLIFSNISEKGDPDPMI